MNNFKISEGKTIAIIGYLTWIGTLIAFIMNNQKRNAFASFHIRQSIGLSVFSLANSVLLDPYAGEWTSRIVSFGLFILWMIGFIGAAQGEKKLVPLFGEIFQDWFKRIA